MSFIVYMFTNKTNYKCYIGITQDLKERCQAHKKAKCNTYFHKAIKKYGYDNFYFDVLDDSSKSRLELKEKEIYWISYFKDNGIELYNLTSGGDGRCSGFMVSKETREKLSIASKGKKRSEEHKKKISEANTGNKHCVGRKYSDETKEKMSIASKKRMNNDEIKKELSNKMKGNTFNLGRKHSEETKQKISESNKVTKNSKRKNIEAENVE